MISALIRGARVLDDERWERLAVRAAEFVQRELYEPGQRRLYRSWCEGSRGEVEAFAEDYALLIQACLDLYEGTAEERWLSWGLALQESLDERFADPAGGYFSTQAGAAHLVLRLKEDYDGAEPAANSVAAMNLFRWRALFPVERGWAERGEALLWSLHNQWGRWPQALPQLLAAIEWALQEPRQLVIAGGTTAPDWLAFRREAFARSGPRQVVLYRTGLESEDFLQRFPTVAAVSVPPTGAEAHVCEGTQCREPVRELAAWRDQLGRR